MRVLDAFNRRLRTITNGTKLDNDADAVLRACSYERDVDNDDKTGSHRYRFT